jgi:ATP-binding cassette subfamily B protein
VLVTRGALSAGELLVFLSYLKAAFKPMQDFAKYSGRMARASAAGERVLDIFDIVPEVADAPDARPAPSFSGAVKFDHVTYGYDSANVVLTDIDFSIRPGQLVSIVGKSGAGKSTIIGMLSRLYDPDRGRVLIDGIDIRQVTVASLRAQVSVVLQDTLLFATSIRENIAFGLPACSDEEIWNAARLANAHQFIESFTDGYDTRVGERGLTLSVGQRQRIAIARAILRKSPILILDEPTSGLDRNSRQSVMDALARLSRRQTTFLITHDFQDNIAADLILYIENGVVRERGTHAELMAAQSSYARLASA